MEHSAQTPSIMHGGEQLQPGEYLTVVEVDDLRLVDPENRHWRTGRKVGRTIYALLSDDPQQPSDDDPLIGTMDTPALAAEAARAHNLDLDIRASR